MTLQVAALPALLGLDLDRLDVVAQVVGLRELRGLVGAVHGHTRQVVLDHARLLADGARLLLGERGGEVKRSDGCGQCGDASAGRGRRGWRQRQGNEGAKCVRHGEGDVDRHLFPFP